MTSKTNPSFPSSLTAPRSTGFPAWWVEYHTKHMMERSCWSNILGWFEYQTKYLMERSDWSKIPRCQDLLNLMTWGRIMSQGCLLFFCFWLNPTFLKQILPKEYFAKTRDLCMNKRHFQNVSKILSTWAGPSLSQLFVASSSEVAGDKRFVNQLNFKTKPQLSTSRSTVAWPSEIFTTTMARYLEVELH